MTYVPRRMRLSVPADSEVARGALQIVRVLNNPVLLKLYSQWHALSCLLIATSTPSSSAEHNNSGYSGASSQGLFTCR